MIWKHRLLCAVTFLVLSVAACAVVYSLPAIYHAEALVLVDGQKIPERFVTATVATELQDRLATISQRILSATRLQKIIEANDLYHEERKTHSQEEVLEMMRNDIKVNVEKGWSRDRPGAFRIAYEGKNPGVVAEVANQIANFFIEENLRARETNAEGTAEFIDSELQMAKKTLDDQEVKVRQYKLEHNGQLPQQENSMLGNLTRLQLQLQGNQDAINRAQQSKTMIESAISMAESSMSSYRQALARRSQAVASGRAPAVTANGEPVRKASETLEQQLEMAKQRYTENHPAITYLKEQLAVVKKQEEKEAATATATATAAKAETANNDNSTTAAANSEPPPSMEQSQMNIREQERLTTLRTQLALAKRELDAQTAERQTILTRLNTIQSKVELLPLREQEMMSLTRDYEMSKAHYQSLLDKKMSAKMATNMERRQQSEKFTILDPARSPEKPIKPNRPAFAAVGVAFSLALALFVGIGREFRKDVVLGEWEMPPDVAVLGRVPYMSVRSEQARGQDDATRPSLRRKLAFLSAAIAVVGIATLAMARHWFS